MRASGIVRSASPGGRLVCADIGLAVAPGTGDLGFSELATIAWPWAVADRVEIGSAAKAASGQISEELCHVVVGDLPGEAEGGLAVVVGLDRVGSPAPQ